MSKYFIDKPIEMSILKVNLMSIGRGLKEKEGQNHETDYLGLVGYGGVEWV